VVLCDFAENYFFVLQDEAQGFHWNNAQAAAIHPFVIYFKKSDALNTEHENLVFLEESDIGTKIKKFQNICGTIRRTQTENSERYTNKILPSNGCSFTAVWKRMLDNEKERHAKTTSSGNVFLKICKGTHKTG
jgi:hypothetical protein